jgi:hypothetical protein
VAAEGQQRKQSRRRPGTLRGHQRNRQRRNPLATSVKWSLECVRSARMARRKGSSPGRPWQCAEIAPLDAATFARAKRRPLDRRCAERVTRRAPIAHKSFFKQTAAVVAGLASSAQVGASITIQTLGESQTIIPTAQRRQLHSLLDQAPHGCSLVVGQSVQFDFKRDAIANRQI